MDNEQIKGTIEHFKGQGETIRVRDIAYTLLSKMFADNKTAYQCLFGSAEGYDDYSDDEMRNKLERYLTEEGLIRSLSTDTETGGLTFEENKMEMEGLIPRIEKGMTDGTIDPIQGFNAIKDIRVKLNDKFKVESKQQDRMIVVERKYNSVCANCHHEIYVPTEEELIEKYGLVKKE